MQHLFALSVYSVIYSLHPWVHTKFIHFKISGTLCKNATDFRPNYRLNRLTFCTAEITGIGSYFIIIIGKTCALLNLVQLPVAQLPKCCMPLSLFLSCHDLFGPVVVCISENALGFYFASFCTYVVAKKFVDLQFQWCYVKPFLTPVCRCIFSKGHANVIRDAFSPLVYLLLYPVLKHLLPRCHASGNFVCVDICFLKFSLAIPSIFSKYGCYNIKVRYVTIVFLQGQRSLWLQAAPNFIETVSLDPRSENLAKFRY